METTDPGGMGGCPPRHGGVSRTEQRATFTGMETSTPEDWAVMGKRFVAHGGGLADRVLAHLRLLDGDFGGFAVDR